MEPHKTRRIRVGKPEGSRAGSARVCRQCTDALSTNPGANSRSRRAGARRPRLLGCPFFGLLFFGQAKKSDSLTAVSETRGNAAGSLRKHKKQKRRTKAKWIPAYAGMTQPREACAGMTKCARA